MFKKVGSNFQIKDRTVLFEPRGAWRILVESGFCGGNAEQTALRADHIFGSETLFIKILFVDYDEGYCIIEMIGEWNDALTNDIMLLKRDIAEDLMYYGVNKFILIGENVLNFHGSDDCYYEEWFQDVEDGWIAGINFREHVIDEFKRNNIDYYINFGGELDDMVWRTLKPLQFFKKVEEQITKRLAI